MSHHRPEHVAEHRSPPVPANRLGPQAAPVTVVMRGGRDETAALCRHLLRAGLAAGIVAAVVVAVHRRPVDSGAADLNLLIITLDTTRADRLGPYGSTSVRTPNLDRLAREGVVFENTWSVAPLTLPAHASLFTGLLPAAHGVRENGGFTLAASQVTLAERLQREGFATAGFAASVVLDESSGMDQGFEAYVGGFRSRGGMPRGPGRLRRPADVVVGQTISWWLARRPARFFAWVHLYDAHAPYQPPEPFRSEYEGRPYDGAIAFVDQQIGVLLDFLDREGVLGRTLVAVVGDHGESLGEHGEQQHGLFLYESVLRVPLIIRAPRPGMAGRRVSTLTRITDVMPTLQELLDVAPDRPVDGVSLVSLMTGRSRGGDLEAYAENTYPRSRFGWGELRAFRSGRYKVIATTRPELYDLERDPHEHHNLFDDRPGLASAMLTRLAALGAGASTSTPSPVAARGDSDRLERLASLGYIDGHRPTLAEGMPSVAPDPKDKVHEYNRLTSRN